MKRGLLLFPHRAGLFVEVVRIDAPMKRGLLLSICFCAFLPAFGQNRCPDEEGIVTEPEEFKELSDLSQNRCPDEEGIVTASASSSDKITSLSE